MCLYDLKTGSFTNNGCALSSVALLIRASSPGLKGLRFDSWSGHMPGCGFHPPSGRMQDGTDPCFSLTLMFLSPLSLPPSPSL